jgi:hypothetical protein
MIRFAARAAWSGAISGRDGLFSTACATIFRRLVARRRRRSPAAAGLLIEGLSKLLP